MESSLIKIIEQNEDYTFLEIETKDFKHLQKVISLQPLNIRYAKPIKSDIETILQLQKLVFIPSENGIVDLPETYESIERILNSGGETLLLSRDTAFIEKIPLENLMNIEYKDLSKISPLRQIAERKDLLEKVKKTYSHTNKEIWYVNSMGAVIKRIGDGSYISNISLGKQIKGLVDKENISNNKIHFGYVEIGPKRQNINIASLRLNLKCGILIDGYEKEVYRKGIPYLRMSHGADYKLDETNKLVIDLSKRNYKSQIRKVLIQGYIGTELTLDKKKNR